MVIRLGVTGLKKIRLSFSVYLLDLFQGRGEKGQCNLVCVRLWVIGLMVVMLMSYSRVASVVLVLFGVGPVLRSRCGNE